jgi:hypothetical protein
MWLKNRIVVCFSILLKKENLTIKGAIVILQAEVLKVALGIAWVYDNFENFERRQSTNFTFVVPSIIISNGCFESLWRSPKSLPKIPDRLPLSIGHIWYNVSFFQATVSSSLLVAKQECSWRRSRELDRISSEPALPAGIGARTREISERVTNETEMSIMSTLFSNQIFLKI